jgi:hypothetical protein
MTHESLDYVGGKRSFLFQSMGAKHQIRIWDSFILCFLTKIIIVYMYTYFFYLNSVVKNELWMDQKEINLVHILFRCIFN